MFQGEDDWPTIKWRRKQSVRNAEEGETEEIWKIAETEASVSTETGDSVDVETELLILDCQKNTNPESTPLKVLEVFEENNGERMKGQI